MSQAVRCGCHRPESSLLGKPMRFPPGAQAFEGDQERSSATGGGWGANPNVTVSFPGAEARSPRVRSVTESRVNRRRAVARTQAGGEGKSGDVTCNIPVVHLETHPIPQCSGAT